MVKRRRSEALTTHVPHDESPKGPRQAKEEHGYTQTGETHEQDRLSSNVIREARPLKREHGLCSKEYRLLFVHRQRP